MAMQIFRWFVVFAIFLGVAYAENAEPGEPIIASCNFLPDVSEDGVATEERSDLPTDVVNVLMLPGPSVRTARQDSDTSQTATEAHHSCDTILGFPSIASSIFAAGDAASAAASHDDHAVNTARFVWDCVRDRYRVMLLSNQSD